MSDTIIKTKKKKYKFTEDANDVLNKLKINGKKKTMPLKETNNPNQKRILSPKRPQNITQNSSNIEIPNPNPLSNKKNEPEILIPNTASRTLKTINIDPNYSLDGKKPTGKKLKEIESFFNNKTESYHHTRDEERHNPVSTVQAIIKKDKELKNMQNNASRVSVKDINNLLFKQKSPQRARQYNDIQNPRHINIKRQEIDHKRTMTNKQQNQKLINEIKRREMENEKLRRRLEEIKNVSAPNNVGKSNSVLILERKKQELINQQRKEMDKILKNRDNIHKIANRKKEIELIRSIEEEKKKLIRLKLEEEKLAKLQYHRELRELTPLNKEKIKNNNVGVKKPTESPKRKPNLDNIGKVIIDDIVQKNKTKKRVRFNLDDNQNYVYIKDNIVNNIEKPAEKHEKKNNPEVLTVVEEPKTIDRDKTIKKVKSIRRLKCYNDKTQSDLFNDSLALKQEYTFYCGVNIFGFDSYKEDYEDIKKIPDKDMKRAIKFDYKFKYLDSLTQFDHNNNIVSRKKINIIPILYNILTNMNITLYKKRKF
jgi:hypothetical protein